MSDSVASPVQTLLPGIAPIASVHHWLGVVSRSHVERGVADGFAQVCHGKAAPLRRMKTGDWLVYYSPRTDFDNGEILQCLTAIGRVVNEHTYQYAMSPNFAPWRRDIAYRHCRPAPIRPLLGRLSFATDPVHWGYALRRGHLAITADDFHLIATAMGVDPHA